MRLSSTVALVALVALGLAADASPSCPTKREARAAHPRAHLYWHGSERCWDNRRGGSRFRERNRKRDRDPVFTKVASADPVPVKILAITYRPILLAPGNDVFQRFLPWEQRVAGSFQ